MKIIKNFFILCENTILDNEKRISLINIYDIIYAAKLPAMHGKLVLAGNMTLQDPTAKDKEIEFSLSIKSPSGKEMIKSASKLRREIDISLSEQAIGLIFTVNGVIFEEFGRYSATLSKDSKEIMSLSFSVKEKKN